MFWKVWFQNRRAKWRRQDKLENTTLRINDEFPSGFISKKSSVAFGSPLPLDPWMTSSVKNSESGSVTSIAPESCIASYPMFATPFSHPGNTMSNSYRGFPGVLGNCPKISDFDPRNSSIVSLRMKAKEHVHCVDKKYWNTQYRLTQYMLHVYSCSVVSKYSIIILLRFFSH